MTAPKGKGREAFPPTSTTDEAGCSFEVSTDGGKTWITEAQLRRALAGALIWHVLRWAK